MATITEYPRAEPRVRTLRPCKFCRAKFRPLVSAKLMRRCRWYASRELPKMNTAQQEKPESAKYRGPGKRKCERCARWHRPVRESITLCGSCAARILAVAWGRP